MSQITSGIRSVLSIPIVYSSLQFVMGAQSIWKHIVNDLIHAKSGMAVLDIGCGPADILSYLPEGTQYWGYDISEEYIKKAQKKYGARGNFVCKLLNEHDLENLPKFDRVVLTGVLHHLDDDVAKQVIRLAYMALNEGGKLVSVDPCFAHNQHPIARFLISQDRGQNVRAESAYKTLVNKVFKNVQSTVVHRSLIPYTHCYMICEK